MMTDNRAPLIERLRNNHFAGMEVMREFALSIITAAEARVKELEGERKLYREDNERLERETREFHGAILGDKPDYSMLAHENFIEMIKAVEAGRIGAIDRALAAEAENARLREALRNFVDIDDRDNLTDPDRAATDEWRAEVINIARAALHLASEANAPRSLTAEEMRADCVAKATEMTLKWGRATGTDYEQGMQDQGYRIIHQLNALPTTTQSGGV